MYRATPVEIQNKTTNIQIAIIIQTWMEQQQKRREKLSTIQKELGKKGYKEKGASHIRIFIFSRTTFQFPLLFLLVLFLVFLCPSLLSLSPVSASVLYKVEITIPSTSATANTFSFLSLFPSCSESFSKFLFWCFLLLAFRLPIFQLENYARGDGVRTGEIFYFEMCTFGMQTFFFLWEKPIFQDFVLLTNFFKPLSAIH